MSETKDELAGVVDLFDALTRRELAEALAELAFKQGKEVDESAFEAVIEDGVRDFYLVETNTDDNTVADGDPLLVPGPVAFPALPENAEDLPHIMDVPVRTIDREGLGARVKHRLAEEAEQLAEGIETDDEKAETDDEERVRYLVDVSYDLEAWAPVEAGNVRERLDEAISS